MSREIKFRAWVKENSSMFSVKQIMFSLGDVKGVFCHEKDNWLDQYEVVLMQFTGLQDKNGVFIYEGDIILWSPNIHGRNEKPGVIQWNQKEGFWGISNNKVGFCAGIYRHKIVIGNIHENPELIP